MKKIIASLLLLSAAACAPRWAMAEGIKRTPSDIATWQIKGSTDVGLGISSHGVVYNTEGLVSVREPFPFIVAPASGAILNHSTATVGLVSNGGVGLTGLVQPRYPTPITLAAHYTNNTTSASVVFNATVTITGIDSTGATRTSRLALNPGTFPNTGFAYASISTITIGIVNSTGAAIDGSGVGPDVFISFGSTGTIGLANDITDGGMYASWQNNVLQTSITYNAGFNTWTPNATPNYSLTVSTALAGNQNPKALNNYYEVLYRAHQSPPDRNRPDLP